MTVAAGTIDRWICASGRPAASTRHPWELVRADFFERLLADHDLLDARRWLDVGAGDAWFATELVERLPADATVTCWDINYTTEDLGRARS